MKVKIGSVGSIYVHAYFMEKAGERNDGHSHTYDHFMLLSRGAVEVESNGRRSVFRCTQEEPFALIFIPRGVQHHITALEDNTVLSCLHALHSRDNPGDILDPASVPAGTPPWSLAVPLLEADARKQGFSYEKTQIAK